MKDERTSSAPDAEETAALRAIGWRRSGASCPDSSLLMAAHEGVLEERAAGRIRSHVAGCATCQLLVRDLAEVLGEDAAPDLSARVRERIDASEAPHRQPYLWWGAGLAAAAALAWFFLVPKSAPAPVPETQVARVTPPPIASVFVVDRPNLPPGDVDLTVRGETAPISLEDQIKLALDKADRGELNAASSDLQAIAKRHSGSRIAALAFGAIQLRAGQNADATASLERARTLPGDTATADEAGWFLAIALVRTAQFDRARVLLEDVCKHAGPRSASACAGMAEIDRNKSAK